MLYKYVVRLTVSVYCWLCLMSLGNKTHTIVTWMDTLHFNNILGMI